MPVQRLVIHRKRLPARGDGEILLVLDPRIVKDNEEIPDRPLAPKHGSMVAEMARSTGLSLDKLASISCAMPVSEEIWGRDKLLSAPIMARC